MGVVRLAACATMAAALAACGSGSSGTTAAMATPTATVATPLQTATPPAINTAVATSTSTATSFATNSPTTLPTTSSTPRPSDSATPLPTDTVAPPASDTATPRSTDTSTATPTAIDTTTPSASPSPTATPTVTDTGTATATPTAAPQSVARQWDEEALAAIRIDLPRPPIHARNLFHLSVAMWDAWATYDPNALGYLTTEKHASADPAADRAEAISYAAYRILTERYRISPNAATSLAAFGARMAALGYDPNVTTADGDTPAAIGNRIAATVIAYGLSDGSNEANNYADPTYSPVNEPLIVALPGTTMEDPNRWQPLALSHQVTQNGIPIPGNVQVFVAPQWAGVRAFAADFDALVPGPPPRLHDPDTDAAFKQAAVDVIRASSELTPDDGVTMDISPATFGNNPLGTNDGGGYPRNPVTDDPYPPNVVKRGDFRRVIAEFWADGPNSETPPGHWNVIANQVSDNPLTVKRIGGSGPVVDDLEWDVKLYLAVNAAVHDAAVGCWGTKRVYDSVRPISMIRYMGELGQSSDPSGPSYHPDGLPLIPGLIEVITPESSAPGERHADLADFVGEIALFAWGGGPMDPTTQHSGARWIRAKEWVPYQKDTFVTPAFASYTSGHSTFSRAAAEVLVRFTGSPYFPGGIARFDFAKNQFLKFESGPSSDLELQWATYYDASDQAGQSRIWGGIHILADDFGGRRMGSAIGADVYDKAHTYWVQFATVTPVSTQTPTATASATPDTSATASPTPTATGALATTSTPTPLPSARPPVDFVLQNLPGALLSISGTTATDVYTVGADANDGSGPMMLHYDGQSWRRLLTGATNTLWWISVTPIDGDFYLAGDGGLIERYRPSNGQFQIQTTPSSAPTLFGIWGADPTHIWAVGGDLLDPDAGGVVWRYDGSTWSADPTLADFRPAGVPTLYKVWGRSTSDVYVSGRNGIVLHFDGAQWSAVPVDAGGIDLSQLPLFTIHGNAAQVVASGGFSAGALFELSGGTFENRAPSLAPQMNGVFLAPDGTGVAVGVAGTVALRDDAGWHLQAPAIQTGLDFHGAWIDPDGGKWAVGGELTTSLDQGIVAYGGSATISGTIVTGP
jgi:hypothetical protein